MVKKQHNGVPNASFKQAMAMTDAQLESDV